MKSFCKSVKQTKMYMFIPNPAPRKTNKESHPRMNVIISWSSFYLSRVCSSQQRKAAAFAAAQKRRTKKKVQRPPFGKNLRRKISKSRRKKQSVFFFHQSSMWCSREQSIFLCLHTHTHKTHLRVLFKKLLLLFVRSFVCTATTLKLRRRIVSSSLTRIIHHQRSWWWFMYT